MPAPQVTTDIGAAGSAALVLRASGSTVESAGYMAATKDQDDLETSTVASSLGRELQARCLHIQQLTDKCMTSDADLP